MMIKEIMTIMLIRLGRLAAITAALLLLLSASAAPAASALAVYHPEARSENAESGNANAGKTDPASEGSLKPVQVFDVSQGKVVKSVPNDKKFQKMAKSWLRSVTGLAPQLSSDNSCTYVYRVPLAEPAEVKAGAVTVVTRDLFLFYCQDNPPLMLVFDDARKPYLLLFDRDLKPFIRKVGVPELAE